MKQCTEKLLRLLPLETEPLWLELWSGCRLHPHPPSLPSSCSAGWPCHAWLSWTLRCCSVLHRWAVRLEVRACKGWCHLRGQESFLVLKTCQLLFNITEYHVTNIKATCQGECLFPYWSRLEHSKVSIYFWLLWKESSIDLFWHSAREVTPSVRSWPFLFPNAPTRILILCFVWTERLSFQCFLSPLISDLCILHGILEIHY